MKKYSLLLIVVFLISISSSLQQAAAQENAKTEQEKESEIQKAIEIQKKAMADQKKAQTEAEAAIVDQNAATDELLKDVQVKVESAGRAPESMRFYGTRGGRTISTTGSYINFDSQGSVFFGHGPGGDTERTTWDFSKSVKESTFSKNYAFDVEKTVKTVVMSVMGDCKAGEIRIKILMPSGKNYSDIVIDEFGNLNWRKSFEITETENLDKAGEWKFQITSTKATGFFKISLQTY